MSTELAILVLARWVHILSAIVLVGGALFLWCALWPALRDVADDEARSRLQAAVAGRWRKLAMAAIGLLLLSGMYNFVVSSIPRAKEADVTAVYHAIFGVKFLAAIGVFFLTSVLLGRAPAFDRMRATPGKWLALNALLAVAVVLLSGVLKNLGS